MHKNNNLKSLDSIETKELSLTYISKFISKDDPIIIEAGAHIGRNTIKMKKIWPKSKIYAFEPVNYLYNQLIKNTKNYNNIFCYNIAFSDNIGKKTMYVSYGRSTAISSLYIPTDNITKNKDIAFKIELIDTDTFDNWANKNNIKNIDFFWLDMQGSELLLLDHAIFFLKNTQAIFIEVNLIERYKDIPLYFDVMNFLEKLNFVAVAKSTCKNYKMNILFINKLFF